MFGLPAADPLTPHIERAQFQLPTHKLNDLRLIESILGLNDLERGSVFPGHFYNATDIVTRQFFVGLVHTFPLRVVFFTGAPLLRSLIKGHRPPR